MGTVPTGALERELRKAFIAWVNTLPAETGRPEEYLARFKRQSLALINKRGGQIARLGVSAGFPAPKELDLDLVAGHIYSEMELAVIRAQIMTGLNARESARALLRAGVQKEYYKLERLARTETVRAYWKNQRAEAANLGMVLVWSVENGPRTCDWCRERDGLVVDEGAHDHPNGRCTLLPMLPSRVKYKGSVAADGSIYYNPDAVRVAPGDAESKVFPGMTQAEENAVARYTSNSFEINAALRDGKTTPDTELLDSAFQSASLERSTKVYRVVEGNPAYEAISQAKDGFYTDKAFFSTQKAGHQSINELVDEFAVLGERRVLFEVDIPKGYPAIDIGGKLDDHALGLGYNQGEVLLPRGTKFKVSKIDVLPDGTFRIRMRPTRRK